TMDFNHPMAGKTLHFTGKVESVREATEKELREGLHGEYLPPEEGCGHCHGECHKDEDGCCHGEGECKEGCGCKQ
ncbi:MAG: peptidylprolyl isomerase, partial [Bacteroidales bacterium]|nr:peptidylprolyl isomerase [Bacteroidales bacterium]